MRLSGESLRGLIVLTADGRAIGEVATFVVDTVTWSVHSLQVRLKNDAASELGAPRGVFHAAQAEIPIVLVRSVADAVLLTTTIEGLRQLSPAAAPGPTTH
jgi:sporulation protein YlmC with PRC-barrel domain